MRDLILSELEQIEADERVKVLFACESGSRAWGFPSEDSDYDVRFIYAHPLDWYLSIFDRRDVIERPIHRGLDINGWDLRKALQLFSKSNPPLMEWLGSPIVYKESYSVASELRALAPRVCNRAHCLHHYFSMARHNYRDYLQGDEVWIKKYLYVLRPLLAMQWIERGLGMPPTDFNVLVERLVEQDELRRAIRDLLAAKRTRAELARGPRIPAISSFIDAEVERWQRTGVHGPADRVPVAELDDLFRASLAEVWS